MSKVIFLDTNLYLHYQPVEQIDWCDVLETKEVTIVIPPVIVRELNKNKEVHLRSKVRKRADRVIKWLFSKFESASRADIRDGVEIRLEARDPAIKFSDYGLSFEFQDDYLIASIVMFRNENPEREVMLVTSDLGLTLMSKANRLDISTFRLPDEFKLPEEPDPEQARVRELEEKIRKLELRLPRLSLAFEDGKQHAVFVLPEPIEPAEAELEGKLRRIERKHPKMKHQTEQVREQSDEFKAVAETIANLNASLGNTIQDEDIDNYNSRLEQFYEEYNNYLEEVARYRNLKSRAIEVEIFVVNEGSAPAEDVDVFMHFPDGFWLTDREGMPKPPQPPQPPRKPRSRLQELLDPAIMAPVSVPSSLYPVSAPVSTVKPNVSTHNIVRVDSYDVDFHIQKLKHKLKEPAKPLYIVFESFQDARPFHIDYRILAANVPEEVSGQLHVVIKKDK